MDKASAQKTNAFLVVYKNDSIKRIDFYSHGKKVVFPHIATLDPSIGALQWNFIPGVASIDIDLENGYEKRRFLDNNNRPVNLYNSSIQRLKIEDDLYTQVYFYDSLLNPVTEQNPISPYNSIVNSETIEYTKHDTIWKFQTDKEGHVLNKRRPVELLIANNRQHSKTGITYDNLTRTFLGIDGSWDGSYKSNFDKDGILSEWSSLDPNGKMMPNELYSKEIYEFNEYGDLTSITRYNHLNMIINTNTTVPIIKYYYDGNHNLIKQEYYEQDYTFWRDESCRWIYDRDSLSGRISHIHAYDRFNEKAPVDGFAYDIYVLPDTESDSLIIKSFDAEGNLLFLKREWDAL